jgi:uncharacterized iron-regulated membrane protein
LGIADDLVHHPRRTLLRRAAFQIHLWAGLAVAVYLIAISLSGCVLVFKDELTRWSLPGNLHALGVGRTATPEEVVDRFRQMEPRGTLTQLQLPTSVLPVFLLQGETDEGRPERWLGDPVTGDLRQAPRTWIDWTHDLHDYLLLPQGWGMQVNGVGAAMLLLLAGTGVVVWWQGVRLWTRGFRVKLTSNWRRINYDLHGAIGFWTLAIVVWWAISGVYFGWYRQVTAVVSVISPLRGMAAPGASPLPPVGDSERGSLERVIAAAQSVSPGGRLWSISGPDLRSGESYLLFDRGAPGDFAHRDIVRMRTADARVISVWHYGERHSLGDWILWAMHPLHFGTVWGLTVKVIWAALGLTLAVLTVTGVLMYWNRYLRRVWASRVAG